MLENTQPVTAFAMLCFMAGCGAVTAQTKPVLVSSNNPKDKIVDEFIKEGLGCTEDQIYVVYESGKCECVTPSAIAGL